MNKCNKCGKLKPSSEFYKNRARKEGVTSYCKSCMKEYEKSESGREVKQRYNKSNKGKAKISRYDKSEKGKRGKQRYSQSKKGKIASSRYDQSEKGKAAKSRFWQSPIGKAAAKRKQKAHPKKYQARRAVNNAVRDNRFPNISTQKCIVCNDAAVAYHHYKGYEKRYWLAVQPLCQNHHNEMHK